MRRARSLGGEQCSEDMFYLVLSRDDWKSIKRARNRGVWRERGKAVTTTPKLSNQAIPNRRMSAILKSVTVLADDFCQFPENIVVFVARVMVQVHEPECRWTCLGAALALGVS